MKRKILIGSILAVALLTLVSFSNVVGYQSVKTSQADEIIQSKDLKYNIIGRVTTVNTFKKLPNSDEYEGVRRIGRHDNSIVTLGVKFEDNYGRRYYPSQGFLRSESLTGDVEIWYKEDIWGNLGKIYDSGHGFGVDWFQDFYIGMKNFTGIMIPCLKFTKSGVDLCHIIIGRCMQVSIKDNP